MMSASVTLNPTESRNVMKVVNFLTRGNRGNSHAHIVGKLRNGAITVMVAVAENLYDVIVDGKMFGVRFDEPGAEYAWTNIDRVA